MFIHFELVILVLALTFDGQGHAQGISRDHEAVPHSRPYMVLLEEDTEGSKKYCSGFLLNEDFVMTAASCRASSYTAFLGVHNFFNHNEQQRIPVDQAFPHQDFDATSFKNDIMLLKLSTKVNFNKNVRPIALADEGDDSLPNSCLISGWGSTDKTTNYMSPVLMEVNITLIDNEHCAKENLYCAEGLTGPAKGDAGSPLVCEDGKAYGLVSFRTQNSDNAQIHYYTKIPVHRGWIGFIMTALKRFNTCHI